jgi:hypothetical protein
MVNSDGLPRGGFGGNEHLYPVKVRALTKCKGGGAGSDTTLEWFHSCVRGVRWLVCTRVACARLVWRIEHFGNITQPFLGRF